MNVKTTRITHDTDISSLTPHTSNQRTSIIETPCDVSSINSEIVTDTRIKSLESSLGGIFNHICNSESATIALGTSYTVDNDETPALPK